MSNFGIVHDVPMTMDAAYYTVDRIGVLRCNSCDSDLSRAEHEPMMIDRAREDEPCDLCSGTVWDSRIQVAATGSVEYVACKIF